MKIAVFGATGKTGKLVVDRALERGHTVVAFARDPSKITDTNPHLQIVRGDATDREAVARAINGCDAVISALSSGKNTSTTFGKFVVPVMQEAGVRRIVSLVGAGVSEPGDYSSIGGTLIFWLLNLMAKDVLQDAERHASLLRNSDLDWTLVRPPRLADGPATGQIEHAAHLKMGPSHKVTRADLAAFMLDLATSDQYVRQSPMVANT